MALLILSVMILPKDNHREENLFMLPQYLCVQCFVCVCVCVSVWRCYVHVNPAGICVCFHVFENRLKGVKSFVLYFC